MDFLVYPELSNRRFTKSYYCFYELDFGFTSTLKPS